MKKIILYKANGVWIAKHLVNGEPCPRVASLFGTCDLPMPFTDIAPATEVLERIQKLNPTAVVEVRP